MFSGVHTALITPFKNGDIDYDSLEKIIEHQVAGGVDGVVPMGTTGESPTLSHDKHKELIARVVEMVDGRVKVVAGTGSNSTAEAISLSQSAEKSGVDALLQVNPYYNKPPQHGLIEHFEAVAKSVSIPIILYNIPGRTGINFLPESVARLMDRTDNVVAIKEASGDINQMMRVVELCGDRLTLLSGDDNMLLPLLSIGGRGIVSVLSNLLPADIKKIVTLYEGGKLAEARSLFYKILPLCRAMFLETNPIPIKAAMAMSGFCQPDMRLPLTTLSDEYRPKLQKALREYGLNI
ncbi:MAG: 4-hydroxy-tetrahydrodipicolinate synthase [Spirochaetota bacterium]